VDPTRTAGHWPDVEAQIRCVLTLAGSRPDTCIGTGVLPLETDPAVVLRAQEFIKAESSFRPIRRDS
jgi:hypothetical protein